jgi:hypothetical protein
MLENLNYGKERLSINAPGKERGIAINNIRAEIILN